MTNPMYSSQPNYSGVTIQIANPAVYAGGGGMDRVNSYGVSQPQICPNNNYYPQPQNAPAVYTQQEALPSYPPQYYLNNYNYQIMERMRGKIKRLQQKTAWQQLEQMPKTPLNNMSLI